MELTNIIVNREALNARIRYLQSGNVKCYTDGWNLDELQQVLDKGLKRLNDTQRDWLAHNPVALFHLHTEISEQLPDAWYDYLVEDACPLVTKVRDVILNKQSLVERLVELEENNWKSGELERIVKEGLAWLPTDRLKWLYGNPTALMELHVAVKRSNSEFWLR